ncbi:MAG: peptidylprolyl isomerase [Candidatus Methylomirabilia bacterium]
MKRVLVTLPIIMLALGVAGAQAQEGSISPAIQIGSTVELEYTLTNKAGEVLDTNVGREPLSYTQGQSQIISGLEAALNGLRAGDGKQVTVKPEDGYGLVDPKAVAEVRKEVLPQDVTVGMLLVARRPSGGTRLVRVKEIKESTVILDLNHPLAGKTLHFDVKVLRVTPPQPSRKE